MSQSFCNIVKRTNCFVWTDTAIRHYLYCLLANFDSCSTESFKVFQLHFSLLGSSVCYSPLFASKHVASLHAHLQIFYKRLPLLAIWLKDYKKLLKILKLLFVLIHSLFLFYLCTNYNKNVYQKYEVMKNFCVNVSMMLGRSNRGWEVTASCSLLLKLVSFWQRIQDKATNQE